MDRAIEPSASDHPGPEWMRITRLWFLSVGSSGGRPKGPPKPPKEEVPKEIEHPSQLHFDF